MRQRDLVFRISHLSLFFLIFNNFCNRNYHIKQYRYENRTKDFPPLATRQTTEAEKPWNVIKKWNEKNRWKGTVLFRVIIIIHFYAAMFFSGMCKTSYIQQGMPGCSSNWRERLLKGTKVLFTHSKVKRAPSRFGTVMLRHAASYDSPCATWRKAWVLFVYTREIVYDIIACRLSPMSPYFSTTLYNG